MEILGFAPVFVTLGICVFGVFWQIISGMVGKNWKEFNPSMAVTTFMLGVISSIGLVAPVIDAMPDNQSANLQIALVAGQVLLVMGIDSGVRKGQKTGQAIKDKIKNNFDNNLPTPIDDESDLPPGKPEKSNINNMGTLS